jgi:hypothetical protein
VSGKTVALIVTGDVEKKALHLSLNRIFPDVEFDVRLRESFTSNPLPAEPPPNPHLEQLTLVEKLADALIAAVDPGREGKPVDLAVLVDDLELWNMAAPERAIDHIRAAIKKRLEDTWPNLERRQKSAALVRERCSFHLLSPMVEAYFFGEPAALRRAGAQRAAVFNPATRDVEDFQTNDPAFLTPPDDKKIPWAKPSRARHPKHYLRFLCDPSGQSPRAYQETKHGHEALRSLNWQQVLDPDQHACFARAFLADLAEGLNHPRAARMFPGALHPLTSRRARDNVLRNL